MDVNSSLHNTTITTSITPHQVVPSLKPVQSEAEIPLQENKNIGNVANEIFHSPASSNEASQLPPVANITTNVNSIDSKNELPLEGPGTIPFLIQAAMAIKKYAVPIIVGLIGVTFIALSLSSIALSGGSATPFVLAVVGVLLSNISMSTYADLATYDVFKEREIQRLTQELNKKGDDSNPVGPLKKQITNYENENKELNSKVKNLKSQKQLNKNDQKELERMQKKIKENEAKIEKRKEMIQQLSESSVKQSKKTDKIKHHSQAPFIENT